MPRGGVRPNSGRKPTWKAGKTKAVKFPELYIKELTEIARLWDADDYSVEKFNAICVRVALAKRERVANAKRELRENAKRERIKQKKKA